jgi:hypothetical protein
MNTQDMLYRFQEINETFSKTLGKENSLIDTDTMLHYLNMAQERLFKEKYLSAGIDSVVTINRGLNELNKLVKTAPATIKGKSTIYKEAYILRMPDECVFPIKVLAGTVNTITGGNSTTLPSNLISYYNIDRFLTNEYNAPILLRPVYLFNYGGSEVDFSYDTDKYIFLWESLVITQISSNLVQLSDSNSINYYWKDLVNVLLDKEDVDTHVYTFNWSDTTLSQTTVNLEQEYEINWVDIINTQTESITNTTYLFEWLNLTDTQSVQNVEYSYLFNWETPINTQQDNIIQTNFIFNWGNLTESQTVSAVNEVFLFSWSDLYETQSAIEIEISYNFEWNNYINSESEEAVDSNYIFEWDNTVISQTEYFKEALYIFEWSTPLNTETSLEALISFIYDWAELVSVQTTLESSVGYDYNWNDSIPVQTQELMYNVFRFIWGDLINTIVDYITGVGFDWEDTVNRQIPASTIYLPEPPPPND